MKEALAQDELCSLQEPVAWCVYCDGQFNLNIFQVEDVADCEKLRLDLKYPNSKRQVVPLYNAPLKRPWGKPWVSLTDDEFLSIVTWRGPINNPHFDRLEYAKAIDAKLMEKNGG